MTSALSAWALRLSTGCAVRAAIPALTAGHIMDTCQPCCSSRQYLTQGGASEEQHSGKPRAFRRPMRYGSKLAVRDPARFRRMRTILGYPDDESAVKVDHVTISTLQTIKYLMNGPENLELLQGMASYKVTSLNREFAPLLERTQALLDGKRPTASGAVPRFLVQNDAGN